MHSPSLKKTRHVVGQTVEAVRNHADVLQQVVHKIATLEAGLDDLTERNLAGRLRWLLTGK